MIQADVSIIGGSATGLVAGLTAKSSFPDKEVVIIRKKKKSWSPVESPTFWHYRYLWQQYPAR